MQTDALFYELFQTAPQTFFELLQITPLCPYRFESLTLKTAEKRIDGVLEPTVGDHPVYFLEVQAFPDRAIYWRAMREVSTYFEQRPARQDAEWQAVVLWLNQDDDPGLGTLAALSYPPTPRLMAAYLPDLLGKLNDSSLVLNVLRPLITENEDTVKQNVVKWVETIRRAPNLSPPVEQRLITILSQFIEQKFSTLTYKELSQMLRLTPLEETTSGKELIKNERVATLTDLIQRKFGLSLELTNTIHSEIEKLDLPTLKELLNQILAIQTLEQVELWISDHLPKE
jgi:predicted transposase YdaD